MIAENWKNKNGTGDRECKCRTWKNHWMNFTKLDWPSKCSVSGCNNPPTLGAHIYNESETGEWIAPFCDSCNKLREKFDLVGNLVLAPANKNKTCDL